MVVAVQRQVLPRLAAVVARQGRFLSTTRVALDSSADAAEGEHDERTAAIAKYLRSYNAAETKRTGILARKLGMTQTFTLWGERVPLTAFQIEDLQVVEHKTVDRDGYSAMRLGAVNLEPRKVKKPVLGQFRKHKLPPKQHVAEFRVTEDCILPIGTHISCSHFIPGQYVDVQGVTIGKGFQGVMKRHNFKGMPASHGVTLTHRKAGGLGGGQDPGRVWKGKRMEGRMGGVKRYQFGLQVYQIDTRYNLLYVVGSAPGAKNSIVKIRDAMYKPPSFLPIPTLPVELLPKDKIIVPPGENDPFNINISS
ncbi:hypothetical protein PTSG_03748 [Salpingoeca rosetta]|uniref:Large ribosomal subunit protein uL3m n=1 Tax=Salpingoeca rosetta (strain ATCC 50818 / BSB-021) TaxID=946362 RepID=F2U6G6_SALR5|nr:uncharacterized protein PTSG_03748 [Salpingoeca rosetta]EGD83107.1 hypothetical protein PTSG_03748 [Salpingoeca rosetta]|eukprot:XP_004995471.1 hypothetical protein PTSG_03748 [Salpingoeca rosetta]